MSRPLALCGGRGRSPRGRREARDRDGWTRSSERWHLASRPSYLLTNPDRRRPARLCVLHPGLGDADLAALSAAAFTGAAAGGCCWLVASRLSSSIDKRNLRTTAAQRLQQAQLKLLDASSQDEGSDPEQLKREVAKLKALLKRVRARATPQGPAFLWWRFLAVPASFSLCPSRSPDGRGRRSGAGDPGPR